MSGAASAVAPWDVAAVLSVGPIWWLGGKAAQRARLPLITGYLLVRLVRHVPSGRVACASRRGCLHRLYNRDIELLRPVKPVVELSLRPAR